MNQPEVNEGTMSFNIKDVLKDSIEKETNGFVYKTEETESRFEYLSEAIDLAEYLSQSYAYVEVIDSRNEYWVNTGKPTARAWERVIKIFRNGYEFNITTGKAL